MTGADVMAGGAMQELAVETEHVREEAAAKRFGEYLDRANTLARLAQIGEEPRRPGAQTGAHGPDSAQGVRAR